MSRYFMLDSKGRYRGLTNLSDRQAILLREKNWTLILAVTPFRGIHPRMRKSTNEKEE